LDQLHAQAGGGRAQRVTLGLDVFGGDETLAVQRADGFVGERQDAGQVGGRKRALFEHGKDARHRVVGRGIEKQLAGGVAAGIGQRPDFAAVDFRCQRQHAAQHVAQRGAIITGDPAAQAEQFRIEHRLGIDQAQGFAGGKVRRLVVAAQDDASEFARAEGNHNSAARPHAVAEGLGQRVSERPIERRRHTDVNVLEASLGHGNFRIANDGGGTRRGVGWRLFFRPVPDVLGLTVFPRLTKLTKNAPASGRWQAEACHTSKVFGAPSLCANTHGRAGATYPSESCSFVCAEIH